MKKTAIKILALGLALGTIIVLGLWLSGNLSPGHLFHEPPKEIVEQLSHPIGISEIHEDGLRGFTDDYFIQIPWIKKIPQDLPILKDAIAQGVEVDDAGRVFGLVRIDHGGGNDPVKKHIARVNLSDMLIAWGVETTFPVPDGLQQKTTATRYTQYGWDISDYKSSPSASAILEREFQAKKDTAWGKETEEAKRREYKRWEAEYKQVKDCAITAMRWLKANQNPDGSWSKSRPIGVTGVCLLLFVGRGEFTDSKEFGPTVEKAMKFLVDKLEVATVGSVLENETSHAQAVWALSEAYCMTNLPILKNAMEKGVATIIQKQMPCGGWGRGNVSDDKWDLLVSGWQLMALKAAFLAGSDNPNLATSLMKALKFLKETAYHDGFFRRSPDRLTEVLPGMQGVGAFGLCLLQQQKCAETVSARKWLAENGMPKWEDENRVKVSLDDDFDPYGWYFQAWTLLAALREIPKQDGWLKWEQVVWPVFLAQQLPDGHWEMPPVAKGGTVDFCGAEDAVPYYMTALMPFILLPHPHEARWLPQYKKYPWQ